VVLAGLMRWVTFYCRYSILRVTGEIKDADKKIDSVVVSSVLNQMVWISGD
jgi:hypothetical protein